MNEKDVFVLLLQAVAIILCTYCIYREKDLIKFERKAGRYIKAFFKALYYTAKEYAGNTHFAEFKRMNVIDMSKTLCEQQLECKNCPVYDMCERGQNGFKVWLESDAKEKF